MSAPEDGAAFEALMEFLKRARAFDFSGYKRPSLERRFARRMDRVGIESYGDYLDFLQVHPEEFEHLFDALLINVTDFFRDPPTWRYLSEEALPELLAAKADDEPIRVWSAGCATGQEAYSMAMVLAEALGEEAYAERVKIYATDVDEDALATARLGSYSAKEVDAVAPELRERYFEPSDQRLSFRKDLRRTVIFGRNDLLFDAPISRLDVLVCRNTLMYFTAEAQAAILRHFHFALQDPGLLVLGKSEMMISDRDLFTPLDLKPRVFRKVSRETTLPPRVAGFVGGDYAELPSSDEERKSRDAALEIGPFAQLIVSRGKRLSFVNLPARALFGLSLKDLGRPFDELELARRPVDLRRAIDDALRDRRRVPLGESRYVPPKGEERVLDVTVTPLVHGSGGPQGVNIVFEDVTRYVAMQRELEGNRRDLELAYEELQSTIDELETINDELRDRTSELNEVNGFFEAMLTSLAVGVAVVDREQRVQVWNRHAENLWGLRRDEALERHLLALDVGLPLDNIAGALRSVVAGASDREQAVLEAVNRRGRTIRCATTILPLRGPGSDGEPRGAIILMADGPAPGSDGRSD